MTGTHSKGLSYIARGAVAALLLGSLTAASVPAGGSVRADGSMPGMGGSMGGVDTTTGEMDMTMTPITGTPSAADMQKVASVLAATKAATSQYVTPMLGMEAGYTHHTRFTPYAHFSNYRYAGLATMSFDPARPTSLLYAVVQGSPTLAGVMYTAPASDTPAQLAQILPSTIVSWHQHMDICYLAQGVRTGVTQAACQSQSGTWAAKSQWMVHAWIFLANPSGMFAIKNPAVQWPSRRA